MEYEIRTGGPATELLLRGRLTFDGNERFRQIVERVATQAGRAVVADVAGLDFIDSAGLGMLLLLNEAMEAVGAKLTLRRPQGQVKRLLGASHFHRLVPVVA